MDYVYNPANRMESITVGSTTVDYVYDGDNRRVTADDGTDAMSYFWSPLGMTLERKNGADHAGYVRMPSGRLLAISGPDGDFYYMADGEGNIAGIIEDRGCGLTQPQGL